MVRDLGVPTVFITFTMNPKHPDLLAALRPGDTVVNRPDLVARFFNLQLQAFLQDLCKDHVLGELAGYTWRIEWQKRKLPHIHFLGIHRKRPKTPREWDVCVSLQLSAQRLVHAYSYARPYS